MRPLLLSLVILATAVPARAGLYYSAEQYAELPAQWRGFLLDQRALRQIAVPASDKVEANPMRLHYEREAKRLEAKSNRSADDIADLGAILIRLGRVDRAVEVLRSAQREHPNHFAIAANLGTAWQLRGELRAASESLRQAVRLAPGKQLAAETLHLKLVEDRLRHPSSAGLDDLFGVHYIGDSGKFEPGKMEEKERKKLPARAVALVQQLALWLPADGPLLHQLAELANAHGDVRNAAAMLEGCVVQFGMSDPETRRRRQQLKEVVDALPAQTTHQPGHAGTLAFRSRKPLLSGSDDLALPPIRTDGVNAIPWELLTATGYEGKFPPRFPKYLQELKGRQVSLTGFMQPLRDDGDLTAFLVIQYPVGCWYCEMPELTGMLYVTLPPGESVTFRRGILRVTGTLELNDSDPEEFLYTLKSAKIAPVD
jgi:hypothetical protein